MLSLKDQLKIIDENYLTGLANKGLVKRAQKELPESGIKIEFTESGMVAAFLDGTAVKIGESPQKFECSCPSRSICKHVLMALLKGKEIPAEKETPSDPEKAFAYVAAATPETLAKACGRSAVAGAFSKIDAGAGAEFDEGEILSIRLADSAVTVQFLPNSDLSEAICSCKRKNCPHKAEAVLHYIKFKGGSLAAFEPPEEREKGFEPPELVIKHVKSFIEEIFSIGLTSLPSNCGERCGQFATLCHGAGLAAFERFFLTAESELELFAKKSAAFQKNRLLSGFAQIYEGCNAFENQNGAALAEIKGKFRQSYREMPRMHVWGLGAFPWHSKSGYCGVTSLFYCQELERILTFGPARPAESESEAQKTIAQLWKIPAGWGIPAGIDSLAKSGLELSGAKISEGWRLSASESTLGTIKGASGLGLDEIQPVFLRDFSKISDLFSLEPDDTQTRYIIARVKRMESGEFDKISQTYISRIFDELGNSLALKIKYSKINETAVLNLEYFARNKITPDAFTLSLALSQENMETMEAAVFPVAVWTGDKLQNLGAEALYSQKEKGGFSKFFKELTKL
ncbi:MAG: SWIM zinc finger family protein [Oscillospiraceae bacterium]|nr:SWIM zinc finger family protein [Oscillospiraceae bacterium]